MTSLAPFLGRFIAIAITWVCGWLAIKFHILISTDAQAQVADQILNFVIGLLTVYAASHKTLNKFINPGDAASSHLAADESTQAARLKRVQG